jgi:hypothetical protein
MSRLTLAVLAACLVASMLGPARARADGMPAVRLAASAVPAGQTEARFTFVNQTSEALSWSTYDGGTVHTGLERLEGGTWTEVGLGWCGMGMDAAPVVVPAGARLALSAYVGAQPGTYRLRFYFTRRLPDGTERHENVASEAFTHR